jgi:vitamin B12 transporter
VTYRFAPAYVFSDTGTKLKASVGTGFKAPTLSQLFQSFPDFGFFANPNLNPETSTGYDVGIEQGLANDTVRLGVTYFHNQMRDLITSDPTFTTNINVGRAMTEGVESFLEYRPAAHLTLRLDYTYTEATDEDTHQELLRRPKHKADFDAAWRPAEAWLVDLTVLWVGSWADGTRETFAPVQAPGYTTVNLAVTYNLSARLALFCRIDNLLDRDYQNPTGFLQPRIGAFAGIKLRL